MVFEHGLVLDAHFPKLKYRRIVALRHAFRLDCHAHQSGGRAPTQGDDTHVEANTSAAIAKQATDRLSAVPLRADLCTDAATPTAAP